MAQIPDSVRVTGLIAPSDDTDAYPSHDSIWGKGGYREVANITARNAIPSLRQTVGMLVWVADRGDGNPETYILTAIGDPGTYAVAFSSTSPWTDAGTYLYPTAGAAKMVSVGQIVAPTDPGAIMQVGGGHLQVGAAWNGPHFVMGTYHFWVDATDKLRMKNGSPASDTDGDLIGMQS